VSDLSTDPGRWGLMSGPYVTDGGEVVWAEVIPTLTRAPWKRRWWYEVHSQVPGLLDKKDLGAGTAFTLRKIIRLATANAYAVAYEAENE
jgi:hypothetical protein